MSELLSCRGITKRFGGIVALDGLSVSINRDEITGIIGPNGAGKTTLFNVVTGVLTPDDGVVEFCGSDITGTAPHKIARDGIARTFQTPRPVRRLTVTENLRVAQNFGSRDDTRASDDQFETVLSMLEMEEHRETKADDLQIVERKHVDLGRALLMESDLILLDEMMAGLNPSETERMVTVIREAHEQFDVDFLVIEHDLQAIRSVSDRIVVIHRGDHLASGAPEEVLERDAVREAYIT